MNILNVLTTTSTVTNSADFPSSSRFPSTVILHSTGVMTATSYTDLQISHDSGITWQNVYYDNVQIRLHGLNNVFTVRAAGQYRVKKNFTTPKAGVKVITEAP